MVRRTCTMSWQPRAPVTRRVLAGLCEGDAPWAGVSEAGPARSLAAAALGWAGTGRTTRSLPLGRRPSAHIRPTARLAAARASRSAGQGTPKQHARAPELRGWAMLVDSQAIMMPGVELAGGSVPAVPPQWPPCKGPSLAPRPQRVGRGPHGHSHCGRRGQASPGRRYWPELPGHHIRDHEEHE